MYILKVRYARSQLNGSKICMNDLKTNCGKQNILITTTITPLPIISFTYTFIGP